MQNKYIFPLMCILLTVTTISCKMNTKEEATPEKVVENTTEELLDENGIPIILGVQKRKTLETAPYDTWFATAHKEHTLDTATIMTIKGELAATDITVFMGTWCEDSQRETPAFYKIMDLAGIDSDSFKLITVSEEKDTPEGLEKGMDITNVPTFIFSQKLKQGKFLVKTSFLLLPGNDRYFPIKKGALYCYNLLL
jgi:thiol-disulfide isomerase/thioredoxin